MDDKDIPTSGPSDWQPITNKADLAVLGKLGEELGECSSAIFRCIIQGIDGKEPITGKLNKNWLEDEVADIRAMMAHLVERVDLNEERINVRTRLKYFYKKPWIDNLAIED